MPSRHVALLLASLALVPTAVLAVPSASAGDPLCTRLHVCLNDPCSLLTDGCGPLPYLVQGCSFYAWWVRGSVPVDGCAASVTLSRCEVEWFGGHGLWSARITCEDVATLP